MESVFVLNGCLKNKESGEIAKEQKSGLDKEKIQNFKVDTGKSMLSDSIEQMIQAMKNAQKEKTDTFPYYCDYQGTRYYFPCNPCKERFANNPENYIARMKRRNYQITQRKLKTITKK